MFYVSPGFSVSYTISQSIHCRKIREKDITKYHIQLCSALLCMYILTLILVVLSAERVDTIIWRLCDLVSPCSLLHTGSCDVDGS